MIKHTYLDLKDYESTLNKYGLDNITVGDWLISGQIDDIGEKWVLIIYSRVQSAFGCLNEVLPILRKFGAPFKLIKNQLKHFHLNAGQIEVEITGHFLSIFTRSITEAVELSEQLSNCFSIKNEQVSVIRNALKLCGGLYAGFIIVKSQIDDEELLEMIVPSRRNIPFSHYEKFLMGKLEKFVLGKYVTIDVLNRFPDGTLSPRGPVYKAVSLKGFTIKEYVIKVGYSGTLDDSLGRDIQDRIESQKNILNKLASEISVPKVYKFIKKNGIAYLVMEYIDGISLHMQWNELRKNLKWYQIEKKVKNQMLYFFSMLIESINRLHNLGYIHRDVTPPNFKIRNGNEIVMLDLELAYPISGDTLPPYLLGTFGYMPPEQRDLFLPTIKEDVFALGANFIYMISGVNPINIVYKDVSSIRDFLLVECNDHLLVNIILDCINVDPNMRPSVMDILRFVDSYMIH